MSDILQGNIARLARASIGKALFSLALPIVLSNALVASYQLVNAFWLGRLGANAIAAVAVSLPVVFLPVALGEGLATAGTILVCQYAGAHDQAGVNHVSAQTLLVVVTTSLLLSVAGFVCAHPLLSLMSVDPGTIRDALRYMQVSFLSVAPMFVFVLFQSILQGTGETRLPLYIMVGSVALNLLLDPFLIFGWGGMPKGGVVGAACATFASECLAAISGLWFFVGDRCSVRLRLNDFIPDLAVIRRIFKLGLPTSIEQCATALGMAVLMSLVSSFGASATAAYGIGFRVLILVQVLALGISAATYALVGQSVGARNPARARHIALVSAAYAFGILIATAVIIFTGAKSIVQFFIPTDAIVIAEGSRVVRAMATALGFMGIEMSLTGAFRGAGDTLIVMVLGITSIWIIQIPAAFVLSRYTELQEQGLWYSFPISAAVSTLLAVLRFRTQSWSPAIPMRKEADSTI